MLKESRDRPNYVYPVATAAFLPGHKIPRKDSFVGEVLLENRVLQDVIEATGVTLDTEDEIEEEGTVSEEDPPQKITPIKEEMMTPPDWASEKSSLSRNISEASSMKEEDPRLDNLK